MNAIRAAKSRSAQPEIQLCAPVSVYDYNTLKDDPLIDPTTIGLKGSPTNIFKSFTPPQKGQGKMLEGADKATCETLAAELLKKHII